MVKDKELYLIDATACFDRTRQAFVEAPLLLNNGEDSTFIYGFLRDFLILRNDLRVDKGIVLVSRDCRDVVSEQQIQKIVDVLENLNIPVVNAAQSSALDICHKFASHATAIYTENDAILCFASGKRYIIRRKTRSEYEYFGSAAVKRKYGIEPDNIATFLSLTRGQKDSVISKNQAIRLIESIGSLEQIYERQHEIPTLGLLSRIKDNEAIILSRYHNLIPSVNSEDTFPDMCNGYAFSVNSKWNEAFLNKLGLHSLIRRLKLPAKVDSNYTVVPSKTSNYEIIDTEKALKALRNKLLETEICAIDTEASSKDSHSATLFGIAFSNGKWNCYVPMLEKDLKSISAKKVLRDIKGVLEDKDKKYIGHNIKYDYVLLRRHGIKLKTIYFDTMLAAFECYGDLDFLNLGFLSKKLLGKTKSPFKEMLGKTDSPWDIPLDKLAGHACEDVEITFQLFRSLQKEITEKSLTPQLSDRSFQLCGLLGDFEFHGIKVNEAALNRYYDNLTEKALKLKQDIDIAAGKEVNIDAEDDVRDLLSTTMGIPLWNKPNKSFIAFLELLAGSHEIPRLIVQYRRLLKDAHSVSVIVNTVKNGRIYPVFSQVKSKSGFVTCTTPDIFGVSDSEDFPSCFESKTYPFFKDTASAIKRAQTLSSDNALKKDMLPDYRINHFICGHPLASGKDSAVLLLSFITGVSDSKMMHHLLIDRQNLVVLRKDIELRYEKLFSFLDKFKSSSLEKGFSEIEGKRKYLVGLKSPNIEKRRKAVQFAAEWLIGYSN